MCRLPPPPAPAPPPPAPAPAPAPAREPARKRSAKPPAAAPPQPAAAAAAAAPAAAAQMAAVGAMPMQAMMSPVAWGAMPAAMTGMAAAGMRPGEGCGVGAGGGQQPPLHALCTTSCWPQPCPHHSSRRAADPKPQSTLPVCPPRGCVRCRHGAGAGGHADACGDDAGGYGRRHAPHVPVWSLRRHDDRCAPPLRCILQAAAHLENHAQPLQLGWAAGAGRTAIAVGRRRPQGCSGCQAGRFSSRGQEPRSHCLPSCCLQACHRAWACMASRRTSWPPFKSSRWR